MQMTSALVTITGLANMTQSRQHGEPKKEKESHDAYDERTWRSKLTLTDDKKSIAIPAHGVHQCLVAAARYNSTPIPGKGKATWTKHFEGGIMISENPSLGIDPASVGFVAISANSNGKRGAGSRVVRRFPVIPLGWSATFEVYILDPIITEAVFREMVENAGIFIGLGQFRPQNGGTNGRFELTSLTWTDRRKLVA